MGATLPERVGQLYYTYGLFCSSHPFPTISFAVSLVLICCYPLLNVPLPGTVPTVVTVPIKTEQLVNESHPNDHHQKAHNSSETYILGNTNKTLKGLDGEIHKLPYVWTNDKPLAYIQQVILKTGISPWNRNLLMWDAFRGPIQEVYRLLEIIRNHQDANTSTTFPDVCYHVDTVKKVDYKENIEQSKILPEYGCLVLSPANLWQQNIQKFSLDPNVVSTIYSYQNLQKGKVSTAEMAFGMQLKDAGMKRYPLRSRGRAIQYAVTLFYEELDDRYIQSLKEKLQKTYPMFRKEQETMVNEVILTYYPGKFNYRELVPLSISFIGLFLYVYFSVRKIEFVKSKFGLALCAVITVGGSLSMSMGLCFFFGLSLSLQGKEIFPYLVILVGLENVLVLTKSVTSTDSRLDVKIRLAQGLSKEGWSITKNLLIEITILTVSLFTFVPVIQEFSIYMIVSLISDFMVQMIFFATILGIDVRRMEYYQERNKLHFKDYFSSGHALNWRFVNDYNDDHLHSPQKMIKSKSHPRLNGLSQTPTDVVASLQNSPAKHDKKLPKRIRLVNIWARTRFFQRAFMVWMVVWISIIVYNSGLMEHFIEGVSSDEVNMENEKPNMNKKKIEMNNQNQNKRDSTVLDFYNHSLEVPQDDHLRALINNTNYENEYNDTADVLSLRHNHLVHPWKRLSKYHWSSILSQYNISVSGKYVVTLPPILLSCRISPELALNLRHPDEKDPPPLRWQALAAALDPIDIMSDLETEHGQIQQWGKSSSSSELPIYPTTPMEILLLAILCGISVVVIAYTMVVFYKVVCTRNYAEWRASWSESEDEKNSNKQQQLVMEALPLVVAGHGHDVECLCTDGEKIVSSCLQGTLKVWHARSGDLVANIDRKMYFKLQKEISEKMSGGKSLNNFKSECESPKEEDIEKTLVNLEPILAPRLKTDLKEHLGSLQASNFSSDFQGIEHLPAEDRSKYQFAKIYRKLFMSDETNEVINHNKNEVNDISHSQNHSNVESHNKNDPPNIDVEVTKRNDCETTLRNRLNKLSYYNNEVNDESKTTMFSIDDSCEENLRNIEASDWEGKPIGESPIWCMDFSSDLIILGCADGHLEFWEASSGKLMCLWQERFPGEDSGITSVRALGGARRVCAAGLSGHLVLLRLEVYNPASGARVDWRFSTAHRRTHVRTGSAGSIQVQSMYEDRTNIARSPPHGYLQDCVSLYSNYDEEVRCVRICFCKPHQQPISVMECEGGRILTGGLDHILKVFSSSDLSPLFTLHGHFGPITSCFIDRATPIIGGSGSQDGLLCVWDLNTGTCLYSMQAHDGAVTSLSYTASYVISAGSDERLCIWDRFQGHMLNSVLIGLNYASNMLPLTHSLLVMGDRNGLTVFDLSTGDVVRRVLLGQNDGCVFVRKILPLKDAIVSDYGNQLRIVRFPLISKLTDTKID